MTSGISADIIKKARKQVDNDTKKVEEEKPESPHVLIKHVEVGESFTGEYYVEKVFEKRARNNNIYSDLSLKDKSGTSFVRFWGKTKAKKGDFAAIDATVEEYMGNPQIVAQKIEVVDRPEDLSDYVSMSETIKQDWEVFNDILNDAVNGHESCRKILTAMFDPSRSSLLERFKESPASVLPHHGVKGGLLAHTVKVSSLAIDIADSYDLTETEKSVLLTSSLLHAVGMVDAYDIEDCSATKTDKGMLIGYELLGATRLASVVKDIREVEGVNSLDDEVVLRIAHAIASHTGEYKSPMTKEALILSKAFEAHKSVVDAIDFIDEDMNTEEEFTAYDPISKRQYFRGKSE